MSQLKDSKVWSRIKPMGFGRGQSMGSCLFGSDKRTIAHNVFNSSAQVGLFSRLLVRLLDLFVCLFVCLLRRNLTKGF